MSKFWEMFNREPELARASYRATRDVFDLAIECWDSFITTEYFKNFTHVSAPFVLYKTQTDVALKQAITSVLMKEYAQGIYNLRLAIENMVVAVYAYEQPKAVLKLLEARRGLDEKVRKASIQYAAAQKPDFSQKIKDLHKMCDKFGSHQSLSHMGYHVQLDDKGFDIALVGRDSPESNVGIAGMVIGVMLEFHFVIAKSAPVEWVKINGTVQSRFAAFEKRLSGLKIKYLPLFIRLL